MRMSNEDFQAEVFRRSAAYQRKQRTRIRILTGAGAFACCLCLTAALGIFMPLFTVKKADTVSETIQMDAEEPNANTHAKQTKEEEKQPVNNAAQSNQDTMDAAAEDSFEEENSEEENTAENTAPPTQPDYDGPTVFAEKSLQEILDYYGLDALPQVLGGNIKLTFDRERGFYHDMDPIGITVAESDPEIVTNDRNTWIYYGEIDDKKYFVYLTLFSWKYGDCEPSYGDVEKDEDSDSVADYAVFAKDGIGVQLELASFDETDMEDHKVLRPLVQEMLDYVCEHKI